VARIGLAPRRPGLRGFLGLLGESRRWLDLVYETLVAFPVHIFTFVVAVSWTGSILGGLTEVFWLHFIPGYDDGHYVSGSVVDFLSLGTVPESVSHSLTMSYILDFVVALIMLALLPLMMRGLAALDAAVMGAALGAGRRPGATATVGGALGCTKVPDDGSRLAPSGTSAGDENGREHPVSAVGWSWIAATAFTLAMVSVSWPLLATLYEIHVVLAMLLAIGLAAMLLCAVPHRTSWMVSAGIGSITAVATALLGSHANGIVENALPWPWPAASIVAISFTCLLGALRHDWRWVLGGWVLLQAPTALVGIFAGPEGLPTGPHVVTDLIVAASVSLLALLIGLGLRALVASRAALAKERRTSAELSAERKEVDERTRIARELHDVVAHSMSVISVQATTAPYRLPGMDESTQAEFSSIADSSRQALSEMRSLLTLLRTPAESDQPQLAPQATLAQIPDLIESTKASGVDITTELDPLSDDLVTPATGLAAYRMVQEGLSNAVRHSPGASIQVSVRITDDAVVVVVGNGPATRDDVPRSPGAGLGLLGAKERASAVGGHTTAEPTDDGGFKLSATLPR
jgi:signal transduction histidine kinase